ncbi:MAG TPA: DUF4868 domain-containing protein [Candidatus Saccharibacteria bacterium]|nr:DUF4868 domain-containing protein [Candidatus Saccharibacteria bacterium]HMR38055.1 DUF4868 domain-containing protein [Candidatus Saccharibacteria bacterium]
MEESNTQPTDIFYWANQADRAKDSLTIDLFLFTKGYTVYATRYDDQLKQQLKVLFLYDMVTGVQTGAASGLAVRDLDNIDREDNVLLRTNLEKVEHAQEVIEQIAYGEETLEVFTEGDHEFKKVKGMVARFTPSEGEPFFVVKLLPQSQVLKGETAWMFSGDSFTRFSADAGLRVTPDNQVLIAGSEIFVFSESKFERLFGYSAKKFAVAEEKIKEIEKHFKLKMPDGMTLSDLARDNKTLINKLQKVDPEMTTQEKLVDQADEMELELMSDEATGEIILMDAKDATKFVDLLSDDYLTSQMTGIKYIVKSKKPLHDEGDKDPLVALAER